MPIACIANQYGPLLHDVAPLSSCSTRVDGVSIVEASTGRVALDDLDTHVYAIGLKSGFDSGLSCGPDAR